MTPTATALAFRALDYRFEVHCPDTGLAGRVADIYRDLADPAPQPDDHRARYELALDAAGDMWTLHCDGADVLGPATGPRVLANLLWHVNAQTTQHRMPGHVVLHAAAAVWGDRAVVLPAPMESGKTTTVTGLLLAGFGYLTDEAAAVCVDDLHVEPFAKSLSVDDGSWPVLSMLEQLDAGGMPTQWQIPVSSLPSSRLAARTRVGTLVLPQYVAGSTTALEPLPRAGALMDLCASTFRFLEEPQRHLDALARLCREVPAYRLTIGSLAEAVDLVRDLMEAP